MINNMKDKNIKSCTYYVFNDIIYIKNFNPSNTKIDQKLYKNFLIYYVGYVTIKKDLKNSNVNLFYLIFGKVNGYFEEINGKKYLMLVITNESKEKIKKCEELCIKIKDLIRSTTKNFSDYDEKYMKIKFDLNDNLPLNKTIKIPIVVIVIRSVFHENHKPYRQVFLDELLYKL